MNVETAVKCENQLIRFKVNNKRLGSAIVCLSTMHNANQISDTAHDFGAYTIEISDYDKNALLNNKGEL